MNDENDRKENETHIRFFKENEEVTNYIIKKYDIHDNLIGIPSFAFSDALIKARQQGFNKAIDKAKKIIDEQTLYFIYGKENIANFDIAARLEQLKKAQGKEANKG